MCSRDGTRAKKSFPPPPVFIIQCLLRTWFCRRDSIMTRRYLPTPTRWQRTIPSWLSANQWVAVRSILHPPLPQRVVRCDSIPILILGISSNIGRTARARCSAQPKTSITPFHMETVWVMVCLNTTRLCRPIQARTIGTRNSAK